jgi:hypothetical protein
MDDVCISPSTSTTNDDDSNDNNDAAIAPPLTTVASLIATIHSATALTFAEDDAAAAHPRLCCSIPVALAAAAQALAAMLAHAPPPAAASDASIVAASALLALFALSSRTLFLGVGVRTAAQALLRQCAALEHCASVAAFVRTHFAQLRLHAALVAGTLDDPAAAAGTRVDMHYAVAGALERVAWARVDGEADVLVPAVLQLVDCVHSSVKSLGLRCAAVCLSACPPAVLARRGWTAVLADAARAQLGLREPSVVAACLAACLAAVRTGAGGAVETAGDALLRRIVRALELEELLALRRIYVGAVAVLARVLGAGCARHLARVLPIVCASIEVADAEGQLAALEALRALVHAGRARMDAHCWLVMLVLCQTWADGQLRGAGDGVVAAAVGDTLAEVVAVCGPSACAVYAAECRALDARLFEPLLARLAL